ncbi:hypothetical protein MHYP_G00237600 [Metynnis hypsauchen]
MSTSVDVHAQLASIIERFAKCALVEMTKIIDNDSALLRAEISRRQMEIESLMCKLQFAESELRSARQAAARQHPPPNLRSVGIQVSNTSTLRGHQETHPDTSQQSSNTKEGGVEPFHVKEERIEVKPWDSGEDPQVEESQGCWEEERDSPNKSGDGCDAYLPSEAKPGVVWDSPEVGDFNMNTAQRPEGSQEAPNTSLGQRNMDVSPSPRENIIIQYHQATECDAITQHRLGRRERAQETSRVSVGGGKAGLRPINVAYEERKIRFPIVLRGFTDLQTLSPQEPLPRMIYTSQNVHSALQE